jgi:MFS family permease
MPIRVSGSPYTLVLRLPGTRAFVTAGIAGRSAHLMTVLSVIFYVSSTRGYSLAGAVAAGYQVGYSAAGPFTARLCDRYRQSRVLPWAALGTGLTRASLLVAAWQETPAWGLVALAALSGATMPSVGSLVRARWSHLLEGSPQLSTALSLESVVDDLIVVGGPVAVAALATAVDPAAGLIGASAFGVAGLAALSTLRTTEPPARPSSHSGRGPVLSAPGFRMLLVTFAAAGATLYSIELATVAFCQEHGSKGSSGWILAILAAASAAAGLWYGARSWRSPSERRLVWALVPFAAGTALFAGAWNIESLVLPAVLFGATVSPVMIAGFSTAGRCVSKWAVTEGMTWITSAMGAGIVIGTSVGGKIVEVWGTRAAFTVTACNAVIAVSAALLTLRALEPHETAAARAATVTDWNASLLEHSQGPPAQERPPTGKPR